MSVGKFEDVLAWHKIYCTKTMVILSQHKHGIHKNIGKGVTNKLKADLGGSGKDVWKGSNPIDDKKIYSKMMQYNRFF